MCSIKASSGKTDSVMHCDKMQAKCFCNPVYSLQSNHPKKKKTDENLASLIFFFLLLNG